MLRYLLSLLCSFAPSFHAVYVLPLIFVAVLVSGTVNVIVGGGSDGLLPLDFHLVN